MKTTEPLEGQVENRGIAHKFEGSEISYALDVIGVSKRFDRVARVSGYSTCKSALLSLFGKSREETRRAQVVLSDVTLRIPQGASVGVIGRNGSGKSTLLKIITGIYQPDSGVVQVNGRIAALIELGAGFHPDFTGRENVMLGGIMHGLTRREVEERFAEIVSFAELGDVIDEPVRTYSSGMFMRLGFSLAVHTDPRVLLVDEVLAVGDAAFVAKCKEKLTALKRGGTTLLLVSHDLDAVERWCDEVLWLEGGDVRDRGEPRRVIDHYRQFLERREERERFAAQEREWERRDEMVDVSESRRANDDEEQSVPMHDIIDESSDASKTANDAGLIEGEAVAGSSRWGSREIEITRVSLTVDDGSQREQAEERFVVSPEDSVSIRLAFTVRQLVDTPVFGVGLHRDDGLLVFGTNTDIDRVSLPSLPEQGVISFTVPRLGLAEGIYTVDVAVHAADGYPYDYQKRALRFSVRSGSGELGVLSPSRLWGVFEA
jgi:lipopolysaccharide transport system ATP-binding protein